MTSMTYCHVQNPLDTLLTAVKSSGTNLSVALGFDTFHLVRSSGDLDQQPIFTSLQVSDTSCVKVEYSMRRKANVKFKKKGAFAKLLLIVVICLGMSAVFQTFYIREKSSNRRLKLVELIDERIDNFFHFSWRNHSDATF